MKNDYMNKRAITLEFFHFFCACFGTDFEPAGGRILSTNLLC